VKTKKPHLYTVALDEASKEALLKAFPPVHKNKRGDHVTVAFKPAEEQMEILDEMLGTPLTITVIGYHVDDLGQAVVIGQNVRLDYRISHITISFADGSSANYSNELVKKPGQVVMPALVLNGHYAAQ
jgi:hypothetical protein